MRRIHAVATLLTLTGIVAPVLAQQGVRAQSPRRDAGQQALRAIEQDQAGRDRAGPSNLAPPATTRPPVYRPAVTRVVRHDRGVVIGGSGIHIGARFGDVEARINLGGDVLVGGSCGWPSHCACRVPHVPHGSFPYGHTRWDTRQAVVQGPTVIIIDRTGVRTNEVDPAEPVVVEHAPRIDPLAAGTAALHRGRAGEAVDHLTAHVLAHEGDRRAERLLGVALVLDGQAELGITVIARAYRGEPALVFEPLGRDTIHSLSSWRRVQRDVQRYAGVHRTGASWLASIALTQAELPMPRHAERLELARRAGLDVDVADALQRWIEGHTAERDGDATPDP